MGMSLSRCTTSIKVSHNSSLVRIVTPATLIGINWEQLHKTMPPLIQPYLPMTSQGRADIKGANRYSRTEVDMEMKFQMDSLNMCLSSISDSQEISSEKKELLDKQEATNPWHKLDIHS